MRPKRADRRYGGCLTLVPVFSAGCGTRSNIRYTQQLLHRTCTGRSWTIRRCQDGQPGMDAGKRSAEPATAGFLLPGKKAGALHPSAEQPVSGPPGLKPGPTEFRHAETCHAQMRRTGTRNAPGNRSVIPATIPVSGPPFQQAPQ